MNNVAPSLAFLKTPFQRTQTAVIKQRSYTYVAIAYCFWLHALKVNMSITNRKVAISGPIGIVM